MKKYFILPFFFLNLTLSFSQSWNWIKTGGGAGDDWSYGIALDKNHSHVYILGDFANTLSIGTTTLTSAGNQDIFIAKYDTSGNFIWAKRAGGIAVDYSSSMCVDDSSNIYFIGTVAGTAVFGNDTVHGLGDYDICFVKFDSSGNLKWVKGIGGSGTDVGGQVVMTKDGNILICGEFSATASFDTMIVTSSGSADAFIAKFTPAGKIIWIKTGSGAGDEMFTSLSVDNNNDILCTGYFTSTATFSANTITSAGAEDVFVAKYSSSGTLLWVKQGGGTLSDISVSLGSDFLGNSYITGSFNGSASFDATTLVSSGGQDIFTSKYDANGNRQWTKQFGSNGTDAGNWIATDKNGNSYVACVTTNAGMAFDILILKYDGIGNLKWTKTNGSTSQDQASYIAVDTSDHIYVAGMFSNQCHFDSTIENSNGYWDFFIGKLHDTITSVGIIEVVSASDILIYPNPTNGIFTIKSGQEKIKKLSVYNWMGEEVYSVSISSGQISCPVNISKEANGIYFLQVETENGRVGKRVVRE